MPAEHRYQRRVQFHETDLAGIVHFSWYFKYMEEAEHALWRSVGMSIAPPNPEFGFPRVNATCDFKAPLKFEEHLEQILDREGWTIVPITLNERSPTT